MSRIRMKVFIRNESDAVLTLAGHELAHGDWTPDWSPPASIGPGERKGLQSEGGAALGVPTTGTEGRVRYAIAGVGGELYVHWDSPLVESQYGNTFHVFAPPDWEVSHCGGQGHEAELEVRLRRSALRSVPLFHPQGRGFLFSNSDFSRDLPVVSIGYLWNRLFESLPGPLSDLRIQKLVDENWLPITHANMGMCGGMVFVAMDYYNHHLLPSDQAAPPTSPDDELFRYIRDRLWESFDVGGEGYKWLAYSSPLYPNGDEGFSQQIAGLAKGRSWISFREEWPAIQADVDAGRLCPVGLVQTNNLDIGSSHQVLAYAYYKSAQDVYLFNYDPNDVGTEVVLKFNVSSTDGEVHVTRIADGQDRTKKRIWCFFKMRNYKLRYPPRGRKFTSARDAMRATRFPRFLPPLPLPAGAPSPNPERRLKKLIAAQPPAQHTSSTVAWLRTL